jgi:hypothetical protein
MIVVSASHGISLDSEDWSSFSCNFHTGSGVNISLPTRITHESPRGMVRLEHVVFWSKSKEATHTTSKCKRVVGIITVIGLEKS